MESNKKISSQFDIWSYLSRRAENYVKIMKKIKADGMPFVPKETERTKKMMDGKMSDAKKKELQEKINVLRSFTKQDDSAAKAKEEL